MKIHTIALSTLITASNSLFGFIELDRGEVILETQFHAVHDSNITGNSNKESDFIFSADPTLRYERKAARGALSASAGMNIIRFNDFSEFDAEDFHGDFNATFPVAAGSPLSGGLKANYSQTTQVDEYVNDLISSDNTSIGLNSVYRLRPKVSLRGNLAYLERNADRFSDTEDKSASIGLIVNEIWQNVGLTLDYRNRRLKSSGDVEAERNDKDNAIFLGLVGQILPPHLFPKLEAFASFSVQKVDTVTNGTKGKRDIVGFNGGLSWEARATTNVNFTFSKDVNVTILDDSLEATNLNFGINQQLSRLLSGDLVIYWRKSNYINLDRNDKRFGASAGLQYVLGRNWSAGARLAYDEGDSNRDIANFSRFQTSVFSVFKF